MNLNAGVTARILLILLIFVNRLYVCKTSLDDVNDVIEVSKKPQIVKHKVTGEPRLIKLKCNVLRNSLRKNRMMSINEIRWEYKKCGYGLHLINCVSSQNMSWIPVMCKNGSKFCDGYTLKLERPTSRESGFYRCLYKNYMSKQFKVHEVFHVDIYDPQESIEILEEPPQYDNQTVTVDKSVTFRCRARSLSPLHMVWMKLVRHQFNVSTVFELGHQKFELITNKGAYHVGNDLYISKLTVKNCQITDNGQYYCIVVSVNNARLMKNKTMSLTVMPILHNRGIELQFGVRNGVFYLWICIAIFIFS